MKKIILRRLELLLNEEWTKEETLENILELIEDYSKKFIIFADDNENRYEINLDKLYTKFSKHYTKTTNINGQKK
jgi:spore germination protein YaaH